MTNTVVSEALAAINGLEYADGSGDQPAAPPPVPAEQKIKELRRLCESGGEAIAEEVRLGIQSLKAYFVRMDELLDDIRGVN